MRPIGADSIEPNLIALKPDREREIAQTIPGLGVDCAQLRWLPGKHRFGFWTALIDPVTGKPLKYLPIDPY